MMTFEYWRIEWVNSYLNAALGYTQLDCVHTLWHHVTMSITLNGLKQAWIPVNVEITLVILPVESAVWCHGSIWYDIIDFVQWLWGVQLPASPFSACCRRGKQTICEEGFFYLKKKKLHIRLNCTVKIIHLS